MKYKMNVCKKMNFLSLELLEKNLPEELKEELRENKINYADDNIIHFRLNAKSNVLNTLDKFPKTLMIIGKY